MQQRERNEEEEEEEEEGKPSLRTRIGSSVGCDRTKMPLNCQLVPIKKMATIVSFFLLFSPPSIRKSARKEKKENEGKEGKGIQPVNCRRRINDPESDFLSFDGSRDRNFCRFFGTRRCAQPFLSFDQNDRKERRMKTNRR